MCADRGFASGILSIYGDWDIPYPPQDLGKSISVEAWNTLSRDVSSVHGQMGGYEETIARCNEVVGSWCAQNNTQESDLVLLCGKKDSLEPSRKFVVNADKDLAAKKQVRKEALEAIENIRKDLSLQTEDAVPDLDELKTDKQKLDDDFIRLNSNMSLQSRSLMPIRPIRRVLLRLRKIETRPRSVLIVGMPSTSISAAHVSAPLCRPTFFVRCSTMRTYTSNKSLTATYLHVVRTMTNFLFWS